ncbi:histidine kinase [Bacillus sp. AFS018417]|uniref:post-transcriptional regulator n=1 Tax=Bacillus TaxID=1386 RepID=UPI000BF38F60|nr:MULTISPECIES: post-transcriptional regulator [unclassified Bacillus (in: firmicutes)]MCP1125312.1 post-transcriptional regulator [Bacillus sp. 3103sda1]PEZ07892.1 histidine kinase [Bacillus sp. AFS018417]
MVGKEELIEAYREQLKIVLESKVEEFQMLGYERVTTEDVWKCLKTRKWKKVASDVRLYELVNDVLTLTANDYMTFLTMKAYQAPLWSFEEYENK